MDPSLRTGLEQFVPRHDTFVGIDSDGCVFDTMEAKQTLCIHTQIIGHWHLERIETLVRETAEFVNLHSCRRGQNRFVCLLHVMDLLSRRPGVSESGVTLPRLDALRAFVDSGRPLSNSSLREAAEATGAPVLQDVLRWSLDVNRDIARLVPTAPVFEHVRTALSNVHRSSDAVCISQTPAEALVREWSGHDLARFVNAVAGQECGSKAAQLRLATQGRYDDKHILMIGDAPGDLRAARAIDALFYPINPGGEPESWARFVDEAYPRFLAGTYMGAYEAACLREFEQLLPQQPPWKESPGSGTQDSGD